MLPDDLIKTSWLLHKSGSSRPKQSDLLRAISTAYYAMFHTLAKCCADLVVGTSSAQRSPEAWHQCYRALEHGAAFKACRNNTVKKFPAEIKKHQKKREELWVELKPTDLR